MRHPLARPFAVVLVLMILVNLWPPTLLPTILAPLTASVAQGAALPATPPPSPPPGSTATAVPSGSATATATPSGSVTATPPATPMGTPLASVTISPPPLPSGTPTAAPTATAPPDLNVVDLALDATRAALQAQVHALPAVTNTLVSGALGGRITSTDGYLTLGLLPGSVALTDTLAVQVQPRSFPAADPHATRNGQPLAFTFELTATQGLGGPRVTQFARDAVLIWQIDPAALAAAGVVGFPLRVYTYNETVGAWEEVLSRWDPATSQLVATTPPLQPL